MADDTGTSRRLRTMAFKFVFAASLVAVAFAATYASSEAAFSDYDLRNVVALGAAVNGAALLGALLALRRKNAVNAALALIVLAGAGTAYIVHTDLWLAGNRALLVLLCAMSLAGLFVAFRVIDEIRGWGEGGVAFAAAALLGLGVAAGGAPVDRSPVSGDLSNLRHVSFQRTPNLYFVSFESMVPRALLRKHLGVETTGLHDLFESEMRRFPNFFADAVATVNSLSTVLSLDVEVYTSQLKRLNEKGRSRNPYSFAGWHPSPLLEILRRNGYETTSIYFDSYLGKRKGPYIDNYVRIVEGAVCEKLDPGLRSIAFWGYCRLEGSRGRNVGRNRWDVPDQTPVVEAIEKAGAKDGPQFVMAHLGSPGHTPTKSFRHGNAGQLERFRNRYIDNSEEAARYLERIVRRLEENDPEAILLVYGDHGPFLSRGLKYEDDPTFVVQDKFGVMGGVRPRDACAAWFDEASAKGWMTVLDAVHAILRCLSGGESALVEPRKDRFPRYGWIPHDVGSFAEFVYE